MRYRKYLAISCFVLIVFSCFLGCHNIGTREGKMITYKITVINDLSEKTHIESFAIIGKPFEEIVSNKNDKEYIDSLYSVDVQNKIACKAGFQDAFAYSWSVDRSFATKNSTVFVFLKREQPACNEGCFFSNVCIDNLLSVIVKDDAEGVYGIFIYEDNSSYTIRGNLAYIT